MRASASLQVEPLSFIWTDSHFRPRKGGQDWACAALMAAAKLRMSGFTCEACGFRLVSGFFGCRGLLSTSGFRMSYDLT